MICMPEHFQECACVCREISGVDALASYLDGATAKLAIFRAEGMSTTARKQILSTSEIREATKTSAAVGAVYA